MALTSQEAARNAIAAQLIELEAGLRQLGLWSAEVRSPESLASDQPFAVDVLEMEQWLQYVFLPTLYDLLKQDAPMPEQCAVAPMAEETLGKKRIPCRALIATLRDLDRLITETH
ncbi:YqcC family protein [Luminiphilus sp.]|nr:YqcC family protein [Luminiphilus sp.]